jgi:hypothetical protein
MNKLQNICLSAPNIILLMWYFIHFICCFQKRDMSLFFPGQHISLTSLQKEGGVSREYSPIIKESEAVQGEWVVSMCYFIVILLKYQKSVVLVCTLCCFGCNHYHATYSHALTAVHSIGKIQLWIRLVPNGRMTKLLRDYHTEYCRGATGATKSPFQKEYVCFCFWLTHIMFKLCVTDSSNSESLFC